jgi:hypothetical protein
MSPALIAETQIPDRAVGEVAGVLCAEWVGGRGVMGSVWAAGAAGGHAGAGSNL